MRGRAGLPALGVAVSAAAILAACISGGSSPVATQPPVLTGSQPSPQAPAADPSPASGPTAAPRGTPITSPVEVPILMYHHVAPTAPDDEFEARLTVLTTDFEEQLTYLSCAGYTGITVGQLIDAMDGAAALPSRPVILTFDDGYGDAYTQAFPLLQRYGFPGSFAIVTGFVGGGDGAYVTWDQVREMAKAGMEMLSHTVSHIDLGTSDDITVRDQLLQSKDAIAQHTGQPVRFLVYPSGEPFRSGTPERQQEVVSMLQEAGYEAALLAGPNGMTQDPAARFQLNRVRVAGGEDLATFAASIGGPACP